jgi:hypothetical protein
VVEATGFWASALRSFILGLNWVARTADRVEHSRGRALAAGSAYTKDRRRNFGD